MTADFFTWCPFIAFLLGAEHACFLPFTPLGSRCVLRRSLRSDFCVDALFPGPPCATAGLDSCLEHNSLGRFPVRVDRRNTLRGDRRRGRGGACDRGSMVAETRGPRGARRRLRPLSSQTCTKDWVTDHSQNLDGRSRNGLEDRARNASFAHRRGRVVTAAMVAPAATCLTQNKQGQRRPQSMPAHEDFSC